MRWRTLVSMMMLTLFSLAAPAEDPKAPKPVLPGYRPDGFIQLPNQWKLNPTGKQIEVGDLPMNIQLHPTGQFAAVLHCGFKDHEVVILDLNAAKQRVLSRVSIPQGFYGLCFSADGKNLYASGGEFDHVHVWDFEKGFLHNPKTISIAHGKGRMVAGGITIHGPSRDLFVTAVWADALVRVPLDNPENQIVIKMAGVLTKPEKPLGDPPSPPDNRKDPNAVPADDEEMGAATAKNNSYPYTVVVTADGKMAFVSLWANGKIAVVDLETNKVVAAVPTAAHPTEMAITPDGKTLYVACANSTQVSVIDVASRAVTQTIHCALYPQAPSGNTPNSLCITPDGEMLFVANADANNLSVFNIADPKLAKPLGFIPVGWYPTSVRYNALDKQLYVANGKGLIGKANRSGPNPVNPVRTSEYIGGLFQGTVSVIAKPTPAAMAKLTRTAYECSPLNAENAPLTGPLAVPADNPIPRKVGDASPIKYVVYIIKENRTYDQVFGDIKEGNGSADLCLFPEAITPNHHQLVRDYVLLDNFYVDGEVSADGHEWSMGAYATDFVEKMWPLSYRGSPKGTFGYPAEGMKDGIARPAGGYIWDRCKEAKVTYRSYGEWVENMKMRPDGTFPDGRATVKALEGNIDPQFRSYDLKYSDLKRANRFLSEVQRFEKDGGMPQLSILRLPNDHTAGTRVGEPTPTAMVAENDLALGQVIEGLTKSKFWPEMAVFVIEDDAQNGPDHVDAHRVVALVVSPFTKKRYTDSTLYSTSSMLRTMELILGLQPMSQFDAAATPMYASFQGKPQVLPYKAKQPKTDLNARNQPGVFGAALSEKFDLTKEDAADDLLFNEVIWRSVKGANSRMPAPVRAAFFLPVKAK
ncbi:MAG: bifunctional YncE family protein/alkaline phosphatase family protein [Gemmataceae bacterium]